VLVGHSAGGAAALLTALRYPDRVQALILEGPLVYDDGNPLTQWLPSLLRTPQGQRLGPWLTRLFAWGSDSFLERCWAHPERISEETRAGYRLPLRAQNWDRGLWQLAAAYRPSNLGDRLDEIQTPAVVIAGDRDRIVPVGDSRRVAAALPQAGLALVPDCGHIPHEECPAEFLGLVEQFLVAQGLHR